MVFRGDRISQTGCFFGKLPKGGGVAEGNKVFPGFTHDTVLASPFQLGRVKTEEPGVH